jgi:predicted ATPase
MAAADVSAALAGISAVLGDGTAVLVVDNCEQLLANLPSIAEEVMGACPHVRILATSREGLGISGELVYTVAPLSSHAAVALFEQRIEGIAIDRDDAPTAIAQICERLDRLPLALELAAARARHLRLTEILERLSDRFALLRTGPRSAPEHQRDLRAVADWSYDLLDDRERVVFERLSVFADGATLEAARSVCAAHGIAPAEIDDLLDRLIDKSLIVADHTGAQTRYRMLQTLRDYAADRLHLRGERDAALRAHALWIRELAERVRFGARTTGALVAAVQDEDVAVRDATRLGRLGAAVAGVGSRRAASQRVPLRSARVGRRFQHHGP